jgi:hypothetical protein
VLLRLLLLLVLELYLLRVVLQFPQGIEHCCHRRAHHGSRGRCMRCHCIRVQVVRRGVMLVVVRVGAHMVLAACRCR